MNKKGFILSTYVYILLTFFLLILGTTLVVLNNTKMLAKKIKDESIQSGEIDAKFSIILQGDKELEIFKDTNFTDPGYLAQTSNGESLEVVVNSNVDTSKVGDYVIIYTVTYNKETKSIVRKVKVLDRETKFTFVESMQIFIVPQTGTYQIELWGAQGATSGGTGGYGGYSTGNINLIKNNILSIFVGGQGSVIDGGYNGGGNGSNMAIIAAAYKNGGGGGGATDIRINEGGLENRIIVSGGGGGGSYISENYNGGSGGGYHGVNGVGRGENQSGGTQSTGYALGIGQNGIAGSSGYAWGESGRGGGGGGYYGGSASQTGANGIAGGGGGSGYIGNSNLTNKYMYCYGCDESTSIETFTVNTIGTSDLRDIINCNEGYSTDPISKCAKAGDGYAKITFIE